MDSLSRTSLTGKRNRAIVWLMYRVGMKVGEVVAMERRHYARGADHLVVPASKRRPERVVQLDRKSRGFLDEWLTARSSLGIRPAAPLFCTTETGSRGRPVRTAYIRTMLAKQARALSIDKRVTPEGLRASRPEQTVGGAGRIERSIEAYVEEDEFRSRYPGAYEKWRDARDLYTVDPERHATRIGHDCREAMIAFAGELAERHSLQIEQ